MAVPSRKNRMMQKIIQNQERDKDKLKSEEMEQKEINKEEHDKRLEMLRKIGLVKEK